jgi:hypothetical protein
MLYSCNWLQETFCWSLLAMQHELWASYWLYCAYYCYGTFTTFHDFLSYQVKVTLRLTVSQSVCLGVKPNSWTFDQNFFFPFKVTVLSFFGTPSLTRGRVCHVSVFVIEVYHSLVYLQQYLHYKFTHVTHNENNYKIIYSYTIYTGLVQSRLCTADYALFTSYLVYHGSILS